MSEDRFVSLKVKISYSSIMIALTCLLLIASPYISQRVNNIVKLCMEILIGLILVCQRKSLRNVISICIPSIVFLTACCYSTIRWSGFSTRTLNAFVTSLAYVLFFCVFYVCSRKMESCRLLNIIKMNIVFYTVILDFFVIITWGKGLGGLDEPVYLLGNKFMVSYFHMALLSLIPLTKKIQNKNKVKQNLKLSAYFVYSIIICRIADTMTGVIGLTSIFILLLILKNRQEILKIISRPVVVLGFFGGTNVIFLLSDFLLTNEFVRAFFLKYSHTDTLLSGRLPMYKIVMNAIQSSYIWGYGINYDIVQATLSFGNPQNGILKMLLDYGVIGLIIFLAILWLAFRNVNRLKNVSAFQGPIVFIYGMLLCSLIEINIDALFFMFLALLANAQINSLKSSDIR